MTEGLVIDKNEQAKSLLAQNVIPSLVIGLGGTGGEILLRLRRKFFEASKSFSLREWPIVEYLYLDTDENDQDIDQYHTQFFRFNRDEFYPAVLPDWTIYTRNLHNNPSLRKWWYEDQQPLRSESLNSGAGQIRGYSRLAMWKHADAVKDRLRRLALRVTGPDASSYMAGRGVPVDSSKFWVYVVGSLAGGTGSGAFIDFGYLLRQLQIPNLEAMAFLVLPSAFEHLSIPKQRLRANSYAALMELEYYSSLHLRNGSFDDKWANNLPEENQLLPPYVRTFLIDGSNLGNQNVGGAEAKEGLFELVAEHIFLDFGQSGFGNKKRSTYVNQDKDLNGTYSYVHRDPKAPEDPERVLLREPFAQSYQTFGLSRIFVPIDRIKKAAAFELWARALRILAGSLTPEDIRPTREQVLQTGRVQLFRGIRRVKGRQLAADDFADALLKSESSGGTLGDLIRQSVEAIRRRTLEGMEKDRPRYEYLGGEFDALEDEFFVQPVQDPVGYREWGTVFRLMEINRQRFIKTLRDEITEVSRQFADDPHRGIGFAVELMEDLKRYLVGPAEGLEKIWKAEHDEARQRLTVRRAQYDTALLNLRQHEDWNWMSAPFLKGTTIRHDIDRTCRITDAWFVEIMWVRYLATCIATAKELAKYIEERVVDLKKVADTLVARSDSFAQRATEFAKVTVSPMDECPYDSKDVVSYYMPKALLREGEEEGQRDEVTRLDQACLDQAARLLSELSYDLDDKRRTGLSVYELPMVCDRLGVETFELTLASAALPVYAPLDDINVIRVFRMKFTDADIRKAKIASVIQRSLPWYGRNARFRDTEPSNLVFLRSYQREVGVEFEEFEQTVRNAIPANLPSMDFEPAAQKHTVTFFTQMAGFPLCFGSGLPALHHAYLESVRSDRDRLHISKEEWRYPSIVYLSNEELMRLREATEIFLIGIALGRVKVLEQGEAGGGDGRHVYYYTFRELGIPRDRQLGIRKVAIQKLIDDAGVRADLRDQILDTLHVLEQQGRITEAKAVVRSYFIEGGPYAVEKPGPGRKYERKPMEFMVLQDFFTSQFGTGAHTELEGLMAGLESFSKRLPDGHLVIKESE